MLGWLREYGDVIRGVEPRARVVFVATMVSIAARVSMNTFLGIHLTHDVGMTVALVGAGLLVESLARGLLQPIAGAWSDRIGRRPVMVAGLAGAGVAILPILLVTNAWQLLAWSALNGAVAALYFPAASALLLDLVPASRRQAALSVNYTALSVGYTIGVAPAGFLAERGFDVLVYVSAAAFLVAALVVAILLRHLPPPEDRPRASLLVEATSAVRDAAFLRLALFAFVFPLGIGLLSYSVPLFGAASGVPEGSLGLLLSVNGVLLIVAAIPVSRRIESSGPFRWLPLAAVLLAASWAVVAWGGDAWLILLSTIVFTFGELLFSSALPVAVAQLAPAGSRGAYQGAWGMLASVATGFALLGAGVLVGAVGWRGAWIVFALHALLAAVGLAFARRALTRAARLREPPGSSPSP